MKQDLIDALTLVAALRGEGDFMQPDATVAAKNYHVEVDPGTAVGRAFQLARKQLVAAAEEYLLTYGSDSGSGGAP